MSIFQLPQHGNLLNMTNQEILEQLTEDERKKRIEQQDIQDQFRCMISLKPEKSTKNLQPLHSQSLDIKVLDQTKLGIKNVQSKGGIDDEENQQEGQNDSQSKDKLKNDLKQKEMKKLVSGLKQDIQTFIILECVQIMTDLIQYVELKVNGDYSNQWEDAVLGITTIYGLSIIILFIYAFKYIIQFCPMKNIAVFYEQNFEKTWMNKYNILIIIYLGILDVLRFEIFLMKMENRLHTYFLTILVNIIIIQRINKKSSNTFVFISTIYMAGRYLSCHYNYIFIFFGSIVASFATSIRYFSSNKYQHQQININKNQQFMTEYFKQFYHNIISMMPQGILIIDEWENLVYANKTTKKILSCKSKSSILQSLTSLIVEDLSKKYKKMGGFDDSKTIKELRTFKSFKSQRSVRKPTVLINNTNSINNTNNLGASFHDSESFVSAYQYQDGFFASPNQSQKNHQVIKPIRDKQLNSTIQAMLQSQGNPQNNINQQKQNKSNFNNNNANNNNNNMNNNNKQNQQNFKQKENVQNNYQNSNNGTEKNSFNNQQQSNQFSIKNTQSVMNQNSGSETKIIQNQFSYTVGGQQNSTNVALTSKNQNNQILENNSQNLQSKQNDKKKDFFQSPQDIIHQQQIQSVLTNQKDELFAQFIPNQNSKSTYTFNNWQNQQQQEAQDQKTINNNNKKKKEMPFKYIQSTGQQNQKSFENLSVMQVISVLLKQCVMKLRGGADLSEIQNNTEQAVAIDTNNYKDNQSMNSNNVKFIGQDNPFTINDHNNLNNQSSPKNNRSRKSSVKQPTKDKFQKYFSQVSESQKSMQRAQENTSNNINNQRYLLDNNSNNNNNNSSQKNGNTSNLPNISSVFNNTLKNNTQIAQNSLSIRVQVKEKLIEITFIQCEAQLPQHQKHQQNSQQNNAQQNKKAQNSSYFQNCSNMTNKYQSDKDTHSKQNQGQSNVSGNGMAVTSLQQPYEQNTTAMILVFLEDITQEVYMKRLEDLNNYKAKMLNSISHELKTPLNCSIGMIDEILNYINSDEFGDSERAQQIRDQLEPAQQSNHLLLYMIRDLIDLGSLELEEKFKYEFTRFNLKEVLESLCEVMKYQGKLKLIDITLVYDNQLGEVFVSDENRLRQILINFLSNSLKFTQKNGRITIKAEWQPNDNVRISVEDNGIGIPQKKIPYIFKLYNRQENYFQRMQSTQGIGIGLSVSYKLAQGLTIEENFEKPIQVKSEEKKGSIFSFILKNQDPKLIDETHLGDQEGYSDNERYGKKLESGRDDFSSFYQDDKNGEKSQIQTNTKLTYQIGQQDIPEDFDLENEDDKENGYRYDKGDDSRFSVDPRKQMIPQYYRPSLDKKYSSNQGDENIQEESDIGLKLDISPLSPQEKAIQVYEKYFQQDLGSVTTKNMRKISTFDSSYLTNNNNNNVNNNNINNFVYHQKTAGESSLNDSLKDQSNNLLNNLTKQGMNSKSNSLSYLNSEENSVLLKLGNHHQSSNQTNQQGSILQVNSLAGLNSGNTNILSVQNSPHPMGSFTSILNIDMQITLEDFILQNLQNKEAAFKEEFGQILIVDDVQFNLLTLQNFLKKYNLKVDLAHDGAEAVSKVKEKYEKTQCTYKIIFMDIQMPIMDGFQATKEIRKYLNEIKQNPIPIIAISAFNDQQYKEHAKKIGMNDYIEKPIQILKLDKAFIKHVIK